jgi:PKD repeat protein
VGGAVASGTASSAWAGVGLLVVPNVASPLQVGQSNLPVSVTLTNASNGPEAGLNVAVTTITLVPSCGTESVLGGDCPAAGVDPGVLRLSATGVGEAGTSCAGITVTTSISDSSQGKYALTPSSSITLGPPGSPSQSCVIDLTADVSHAPTKDANATSPGLQTLQTAFGAGTATDGQPGGGFGTNQVTITPGSLSLVTQVSPNAITLGQSFHDTATLTSPAGAAVPTGTVTFRVYGDPTCSGAPFFTSTNPLSGQSPSAFSNEFVPTSSGTYRVIASYSGDANYAAAVTTCNDVGEQVVVTKASLSLVTQVSPSSITLGQSFHDTATLTAQQGGPAPTGTVTFSVYGDPTCSGAPYFTSTNPLSGQNPSALSSAFTPASSGTYRVIATYSGDADYAAAVTTCNDVGEQVVVNKAPLAITPSVSPASIAEGGSFHATAALGPAPAGGPAPSGTVRFDVYGPSDSTCAGTPVFSSTNPLNGAGTSATSGSFTPTVFGTYRVVATYSGDPNYLATASACNAPGASETVTDELPVAAYTPSTYTPVVGQTVSFDGRASRDPDGSIVAYRWVWGDGSPDGSGATPTHVFTVAATRSVQLYVTDSDGRTAGVGHAITVAGDEAPTAAYSPSTYTPVVNQTVSFDGRGSSDPDGSIVTYQWVWGDGTPDGSGPTPTHVFTTAGSRSVALRVTDSDGQTAQVAHGITVGADEAPAAAYTPSTFNPAAGQTVSFDGRGSSDPDGTVTTYRWVWGDGTPDGSGPTATHAFAAGTYSVALFITDSDGQTASVGHGFTVGDEKPTAAYAPSTYAPKVGQTVSFDGRASSDPDGTITTYRWVWGDGTPDGSGPTPTHVFAAAGTVSVALFVTDSDGQKAAVGHGLTVSP